jgi:hypothetical protein
MPRYRIAIPGWIYGDVLVADHAQLAPKVAQIREGMGEWDYVAKVDGDDLDIGDSVVYTGEGTFEVEDILDLELAPYQAAVDESEGRDQKGRPIVPGRWYVTEGDEDGAICVAGPFKQRRGARRWIARRRREREQEIVPDLTVAALSREDALAALRTVLAGDFTGDRQAARTVWEFTWTPDAAGLGDPGVALAPPIHVNVARVSDNLAQVGLGDCFGVTVRIPTQPALSRNERRLVSALRALLNASRSTVGDYRSHKSAEALVRELDPQRSA